MSLSVYTAPSCKPIIFFKAVISAFSNICVFGASLTLSILPLKGYTPYLSRPTSLSPATAMDFAESPSVKIRVHNALCFPPASLASSNLGSPRIFRVFLPSVALLLVLSLNDANFMTKSANPESAYFLQNLGQTTGQLPNFLAGVISSSFI